MLSRKLRKTPTFVFHPCLNTPETGTVFGSGAYGSVIELTCEEKIVAGKIFQTMSTDHTITVQKKISDELNVI